MNPTEGNYEAASVQKEMNAAGKLPTQSMVAQQCYLLACGEVNFYAREERACRSVFSSCWQYNVRLNGPRHSGNSSSSAQV